MTSSETSPKPNTIIGSIRSQLIFGFGLVLVLALVIAIIGYQSLQSLRTSVDSTLDEAVRIRELSLEIETEFLEARQDESDFLSTWRTVDFEVAQAKNVVANKAHLEEARSSLNKINILIRNSSDLGLQKTLINTDKLVPFFDTYETAFQAVVTDIEELSQPDGQENTLTTTLNKIEAIVSPLPDPELYQLVLQIQANEQSYLNTGQQQYYDTLRLSILEFIDLVQSDSQTTPLEEVSPTSDNTEEETLAQEERVQIPLSELLGLIGIYQKNLNELVTLKGNIEANTIVFREITIEIDELTISILDEGNAGLIRARNQLQTTSDNSRFALTVVSILALGIGILSAFILARRIIGPLDQLNETAQKLGQGNFTHTTQITGGIELVTLANSFNTMGSQIQELIDGLEERVAERTAELEDSAAQTQKRASQLETIADVASSITSIQGIDQLLPYVTQTVSKRFGFYHVGIFLLSEDSKFAVLRAANSEGGQTMLARKHQLRIGQEGVVGFTVNQKKARIALDVGNDAVYFDNPDLPSTRSEMALPLLIGTEIIGVLDVQSREINAFSNEDIDVLTTLANQVAVAIRNANLFRQSEESLKELDVTFQRYISQEWSHFGDQASVLGYRAKQTGLEAIKEPLQKDSKAEKNNTVYKVPIKLRGVAIGYLNIDLDKPVSQYTEDELDIIQATVDRFALAIENARLLETTSRRAGRERLVSEITSKIRSTNDPQLMIQTALDELKAALGASKIELATQKPEISETENVEEG